MPMFLVSERTFIVLDKDFVKGDLAHGQPHVEGLFPEYKGDYFSMHQYGIFYLAAVTMQYSLPLVNNVVELLLEQSVYSGRKMRTYLQDCFFVSGLDHWWLGWL